jgi:hypothetical protein
MAKAVSKFSVKAVMNTEEFKKGVDDMTRKLDRFRRDNAKADSRTSSAQKTGSGRWTDDVKAVSKDFKMLGSVVKVGGAIQAGMDSLMVGTKLWKGDVEGAQQAIESMPFGVGALAASIRELREEWGLMPQSWKDSTELMQEAEADQAKINAQYAAFVSMKERVAEMDKESASIRVATAESAMGGDFGKEYGIKERLKAELAAIDEQRNAWRRANPYARSADVAKYDAAMANKKVALEEQASNAISDIIHKRNVTAYQEELANEAAVYEAQRKYEEELFLFQEENRQKKLAADIEAQRVMQQVEEDTAAWFAEQAQLEEDRAKANRDVALDTGLMAMQAKAGPGSDLATQRARSAIDYERQIKAARDDGNTGLVKQLQLQQALADLQIRKDNIYGGSIGAYDPTTMARGPKMVGAPTFVGETNLMSDPEIGKSIKDIAVTLKKMGIQLPAE